MLSFIRTIRNPNFYHGHGKKPPFFEGWYYKLITTDESYRFAIIPGVFFGEDGHSFVQVLDGREPKVAYNRFPLEQFWASKDKFELRIAENFFSSHKISININNHLTNIHGELFFKNLISFPVTLTSPGIMGWYAWMPFMECYHGIVSLDHQIQGSLIIDEEHIDFSEGRGYIEKDWGQAFPSGYVWMQSNHFGTHGTSFTGSIAMIPWLNRSFRGFIVAFWHANRLYRFATYTGARTTLLDVDDKRVRWHITDSNFNLEIITNRESGGLLKGPSRQDMLRRVEETMSATIELRLQERSGKTIFEGTGRSVSLEVHGDLEALLSEDQ